MSDKKAQNASETAAGVSAEKFERIRRAHQSEVAEDYVEMIAELIEETGEARSVDLAARFGVTSPTVNATIQRLQREGLVESRPYRSIFLTDTGRELATACKARHQLVASFLQALGVEPQQADADAEGMEHHISEQTLSVFAKFLESKAG